MCTGGSARHARAMSTDIVDEAFVRDFVTWQTAPGQLDELERLRRLRLIVAAGLTGLLDELEDELNADADAFTSLEQARWESSPERRWLRRHLENLAGGASSEVEEVLAVDHFFLFADAERSPEHYANWLWSTRLPASAA